MKKKLESELISIAHRILKLKGKEDVLKMHAEVEALYEKLSVLKFAQENFEDNIPTIGSDSSFFGMLDQAFNNKVSDNVEVGDRIYVNLDEIEDDGIMEPAIEKIKDIVAQMPQETQGVDDFLKSVIPVDDAFEELTAGFKDMPVFEAVSPTKTQAKEDTKKTLNDALKGKALTFGLNDKIAFIKHLFDGNSEDFERVVSQINTSQNFEEVSTLIQNIIKPDYNHWEGKEEFEQRFMDIIQSKFE
ncbi:hypothetical protein [Pontimicrobium sp. SW4]|uniref:Uncharacterized protein n=1 Tax=Pontimicrobium sp. SW4 TaxID=3153519 RepID=A0AAU7BSF0_9FLAO